MKKILIGIMLFIPVLVHATCKNHFERLSVFTRDNISFLTQANPTKYLENTYKIIWDKNAPYHFERHNSSSEIYFTYFQKIFIGDKYFAELVKKYKQGSDNEKLFQDIISDWTESLLGPQLNIYDNTMMRSMLGGPLGERSYVLRGEISLEERAAQLMITKEELWAKIQIAFLISSKSQGYDHQYFYKFQKTILETVENLPETQRQVLLHTNTQSNLVSSINNLPSGMVSFTDYSPKILGQVNDNELVVLLEDRIEIVNIYSGKTIRSLNIRPKMRSLVGISIEKEHLALINKNMELEVWNLKNFELERKFPVTLDRFLYPENHTEYGLVFGPNGNISFVATYYSFGIKTFISHINWQNIENGTMAHFKDPSDNIFEEFAFSPNKKQLLTVDSKDFKMKLWNLEDMSYKVFDDKWDFHKVIFSDENTLVFVDSNRNFSIFDIQTMKIKSSYKAGVKELSILIPSPSGEYLITEGQVKMTGYDEGPTKHNLTVYRTATGEKVQTIKMPDALYDSLYIFLEQIENKLMGNAYITNDGKLLITTPWGNKFYRVTPL